MHTHHNPTSLDTEPEHDEHWWPRLADRINDWWMQCEPIRRALPDMLAIPPKPVTAAILTTIASLVTGVVLLAWWLISSLVSVLSTIGSAIADTSRTATHHAIHDGAEHLATSSITRTITDPVHAYLTHHTTGLPITPELTWATWLAATSGLFLFATLGSRGARIGWILTGVTTTAMVYAGTAISGRMLAAGLTATTWAALSIAALNRLATTGEPVYLPILIPHRPTHSDDAD